MIAIHFAIGIIYATDECVFKDSKGTGKVLNLTNIDNMILTSSFWDIENGLANYTYTPCRNGLRCNGRSGMSVKVDANGKCTIIATWDNGVTQPSLDPFPIDDWTFAYKGPDCSDAVKTFSIDYICDNSTDVHVGWVEAYPPYYCTYGWDIGTKYACV